MNQFLSKFAFGFLMAQFFPGAIMIISLTEIYVVSTEYIIPDIQYLFLLSCYKWAYSEITIVVFILLSAGAGMLIHGINWAVLAWLENYDGNVETTSRDIVWHRWRIGYQIIIAPFLMLIELLWLLSAPNIERLTMHENCPEIESAQMTNYAFLQEFYLYFGQFYAHSSYAILVGFICLFYAISKIGFNLFNIKILVLLYILSSLFYLIGRIQLGSLFRAERVLAKGKSSS